MLEVRNLSKRYKPKKGVPVQAIRNVSLKFPEHGMVFLLGKSGSGKSTLLNLLGGLDRCDSGEILIKGVSSKDFDQQHFDSYRNTYVGFIFQEYNVLEEFSVGANIALALELQGRRATDEEINRILDEVDLTGYGSRKPNELSGGQKQRVAIARALVKSPEIIMADEPTGALDSNTGRQVLDTLKKLSADKLVIVVSHDREFAERYADRIIELADGAVIRDVEYLEQESPEEAAPGITYNGDTVTVTGSYRLTEEDRLAINAYLDSLSGGDLDLKIGPSAPARRATPTDVSRLAEQTGESFRLIKSKLPMKSAFKIGVNSLKHKKFRLVVTIFLSCISFGLFGLADTFAAYDHIRACTDSLIDSGVTYASVGKERREGSGTDIWWTSYGKLTDGELDEIARESGVGMNGVYEPFEWDLSLTGNFDPTAEFTQTRYNIYARGLEGLSEITAQRLDELGFTLAAGRLPEGDKDEIAISSYLCETFIIGGYTDGAGSGYQKISRPGDMVGKTLTLGGRTFTVTGVVDTGFDIERYRPLTVEQEHLSTADELVQYALFNELGSYRYSLNNVGMVGAGYISRLAAADPAVQSMDNGWVYFSADVDGTGENWVEINTSYIGTLSDLPDGHILWIDGERTELGEKELVVSLDNLYDYGGAIPDHDSDPEGFREAVKSLSFMGNKIVFDDGVGGYRGSELEGYSVVGILTDYSDILLANESLSEGIVIENDGIYGFAVGAMPQSREGVEHLVSYCYREDQEIRYPLQNAVTYELDTVNDTVTVLARVFLYVGLGFALFAALMLANFISTSISYKKQEIGILRAIGSRSNDVFRIFFAESFVIAMINFVLASVGVGAIVALINQSIRRELGVLITILHFGIRQGALLLAVSLLVAALASFFPVRHIASKRPIDAIRNR